VKTRESSMPDEQIWDSFFNPDVILDKLGIQNVSGNIIDMGCGYGTFTIPAASRTTGWVYAFDIELEMINATKEKAKKNGLDNVVAMRRDFVNKGTGLANYSCNYVMLFNILHAEQPLALLSEAKRILIVGGKVGIIHWIFDPSTPRGPSMSIRPRPEQCQKWLMETGFTLEGTVINLPPFHYGLVGIK
jgi:ubiquinone/menaquinone biosynthesis C-methylase UbiE